MIVSITEVVIKIIRTEIKMSYKASNMTMTETLT